VRTGLTLVEVVIALVILQVGVLGALSSLTLATRTLSNALLLETQIAELTTVLDSLAMVPDPTSDERLSAAGRIRWSTRDGALLVWHEGMESVGDTFYLRPGARGAR
jgi:Tfp pilus assembly protein PilV